MSQEWIWEMVKPLSCPMNCPHHCLQHHVHLMWIANCIAEIGIMHRYGKSAALTGLHNVREMSLTDIKYFRNTWTNQRWVPTYASIDYRCLRRFQLDWLSLVCHTVTLKILTNILTMTKCGKCSISHGWHGTWLLWGRRWSCPSWSKLDIQVKTALW